MVMGRFHRLHPWVAAGLLSAAFGCTEPGPGPADAAGAAETDAAVPLEDPPDAAIADAGVPDAWVTPEEDAGPTPAGDGGLIRRRDAGTPDAAPPELPDAGPIAGCENADIPPGPRPTRLLTRLEYNNTLRDLLADSSRPADGFPTENTVLGFENNADAHTMNVTLLEKLLDAAEDVAHTAVTERLALVLGCDRSVIGDDLCGELFVRRFATQAFRRPVTEAEATALADLFHAQRSLDGFEGALELVIQTVLQSPQFLYRIEGSPDGVQARYTVNGHEMASRLSYYLWGTMPDERLLQAAADGLLSTHSQVEVQARRMLADDRAREAVRSFHRQWLHVDGLKTTSKDSAVYAGYTEAMRASWQESVYRFVDHVFWDGSGTLQQLLTEPVYFVDAALAPLYGNTPPAGTGWTMVRNANERSGLLTQPGLMALLANPNQSSPIRRGLFIREKLMCEAPRSPPPNANVTPPVVDPNATTRERFADHTREEFCQSCHIFIDPVGFGLERFDGVGRYRATEAGQDVDDTGEIIGAEDFALEGAFDGAGELSLKLANSVGVQQCIVRQHMRAAFGRADVQEDSCTTRQLTAVFQATGGNLRELMVAIATHDAFRTADPVVEGGTP